MKLIDASVILLILIISIFAIGGFIVCKYSCENIPIEEESLNLAPQEKKELPPSDNNDDLYYL